MKHVSFNLDSLNIGELLSNDELITIDAGAFISVPPGASTPAPQQPSPGYTEATIIWSQIP